MIDIRELYKRMPLSTHVVGSSDIARIAICPWKFRLPKVFGTPPVRSDRPSSIVGKVTHEILSVAMLGPIIDVWNQNHSDHSSVLNALMKELQGVKEEILKEREEWYKTHGIYVRNLHQNVEDKLIALMLGLAKGFIIKEPPPKNVLTELLISNVQRGHEGRLDVLMENGDGRYTVLDWKTYSENPPRSHSYDHFQIVANGLLANYRYRRDENDFSNCRLAVAYYGNVYFPRTPSIILIEKVKNARWYALECLASRGPKGKLPHWTVCTECDYYFACNFYRDEMYLAREGLLPPEYDAIRRFLWVRRHTVLDKRAISHRMKFIVHEVFQRLGYDKGMEQLAKVGIVKVGYNLVNFDTKERTICLERKVEGQSFSKSTVVRVIGLEKNVPLLACFSTKGSIRRVDGRYVYVKTYGDNVRRVAMQFWKLPIVLMKDEVDLTARELEPLDFIHQKLISLLGRMTNL
ncbi:MAG: PD-(D/E)XK nuclease family protein [Candidatus Baldrarchaeia archaeon]